MLEIVEGEERWGIFFVNGLVAHAFSPADQDLLEFLDRRRVIDDESAQTLREARASGEVLGDVILASEMLSADELAELIRLRLATIVRPLLTRRSGEFNFLLSDSISAADLGYDVESLFRQGGVLPSEILDEGEKAKPLQNLEESMKAGKALLRGESGSEVAAFGFGEEIEEMTARTRAAAETRLEDEDGDDSEEHEEPGEQEPGGTDEEEDLESPFGDQGSDTPFAELDLDEPDDPFGEREPPSVASSEETDEEEAPFGFDEHEERGPGLPSLFPSEEPADWEVEGDGSPEAPGQAGEIPVAAPPAAPVSPVAQEGDAGGGDEPVGSMTAPPQSREGSRFRVEGQSQLGIEDRNVVLYERNPMLRVAAKRAFGQNKFQIFQFGQLAEVQRVTNEMLEANRFFVAFIELDPTRAEEAELLLHQIKRTNRHLPVVVIDQEASLERRHGMLKLGADMYLTKPDQAHLRPAIADQSLRLFADELVQFAEHAIQNWERLTETYGEGEGAVGATLYEIAEKERLNRTRTLMRTLINELADPDNINQLAETILRLANEYLDRAALFAASPTRFIGLGGFGPTGTDAEMNELVRRIRIARDDDSVLREVMVRRETHRGKLRKTEANVKLLQGLGSIHPTQVIVIPVENDGAAVGVLYGDNAGSRSPIGKTSGLEIFLEQAGLALHNAIITNARRKGLDWETK